MKTYKPLLTSGLLFFLAIGCNKDQSKTNEGFTDNLSELTVARTFNWSSSIKGKLHVTVDAPEYMTIDEQWIELIDESGAVLDRAKIQDNSADFYISAPQSSPGLYVYYPNTQEKIKITSTPNVVLKLKDLKFEEGFLPEAFNIHKSGIIKGKASSGNLLSEGDFENATLLYSGTPYNVLHTTGAWYNKTLASVITTISGNKVFTSNSSSQDAKIAQAISISGDEKFDFEYNYTGNAGFYILFFNDKKQFIGYTTVSIDGTTGTANFLTSSTVKYIQVYGFAGQGEWLDDVSLVKVPEPDTDADGVIDRKDDYPNDPARAFATFFPTIGRQTLAFEDLWPYQGDHDYNDLVLANLVEFSSDASGNLVDATFKIRVDAMGAGLSNSLALVLLDDDHNPLNTNIISGISGDASLDPAVVNGVIILDDITSSLDNYYTNTGSGPDGVPEEFTFTITFNSNAGTQNLITDFYIYRTNDRGKEIHLSGFIGTSAANPAYYNTYNDYNGTYKTKSGIPWVIEIIYPNTIFFSHTLEKVDISAAYPQFQPWAKSQGKKYIGWMFYPNKSKIYKK